MPTLQRNSTRNKTLSDTAETNFRSTPGQSVPDVLATSANERYALRNQWDEVINYKLIEWGRNSGALVGDGLKPPTREAIKKACKVAVDMRELGWPLPTGIIPDGEGGVVFENRNEPTYQRLEIEDDGCSMYLVTFKDCTFQSRDLVEINRPSR